MLNRPQTIEVTPPNSTVDAIAQRVHPVNREDKSRLLKLDPRKPAVLESWPLAPGETPSSLAISAIRKVQDRPWNPYRSTPASW